MSSELPEHQPNRHASTDTERRSPLPPMWGWYLIFLHGSAALTFGLFVMGLTLSHFETVGWPVELWESGAVRAWSIEGPSALAGFYTTVGSGIGIRAGALVTAALALRRARRGDSPAARRLLTGGLALCLADMIPLLLSASARAGLVDTVAGSGVWWAARTPVLIGNGLSWAVLDRAVGPFEWLGWVWLAAPLFAGLSFLIVLRQTAAQ